MLLEVFALVKQIQSTSAVHYPICKLSRRLSLIRSTEHSIGIFDTTPRYQTALWLLWCPNILDAETAMPCNNP